MNKKHLLLLLFIIILSILLRFWRLGEVPASPDWDEVSLGYNAYSIFQTGRDEYGKVLPLVLQSFNDFKPGFYAYLAIPFIKILGLTVFAVRFPSAVFGVLTVVGVYFLVKDLFKNNPKIALFATLLVAISPWHIQFSRVAFEANIGLAFNLFGVLFFLKGLKKPSLLLISALFISLNLYVYQGEKVFSPLILLVLLIIYRKDIAQTSKKYLISSLILILFISLPMLLFTFGNKNGLARASGVSVFSDSKLISGSIQRLERDRQNNDIIGIIFDNRRIVLVKNIFFGYISHFDFNWLFIRGDSTQSRHHAPNMGLLYLLEFPFLLIGLYKLVFDENSNTKTKIFMFSWFLIAPIPAAITTDVPHAVRTINFLPTFQIFTALGIVSLLSYPKNRKYLFLIFFLPLFAINFFYYLNQYFVQQNYFNASSWQYGYKDLVDFLKPVRGNFKKIIVSDKGEMSQSYMFFLFYLKYDPKLYLSEGGTIQGKNRFSNFEFRPIDYYNEKESNILLVGAPSDFPEIFREIKTIHYPNDSVAIRVMERK